MLWAVDKTDKVMEVRQEPEPVFIVGAARSGTTLLQQILDHHPSFAFPWESHFIPEFYHHLSGFGDLGKPENRLKLIRAIARYVHIVWLEQAEGQWIPGLAEEAPRLAEISPPTFAGVVDTVFSFGAAQRNRKRWGDKTPGYVDSLPLILEIFPKAKFLHIIRDGRDVGSSILPLSFGPNTIFVGAKKWKKCVQHGLSFAERHPDKVYTFRYEDLLDDTEKHIREICAFLGEEFYPPMLDYHKDSSARVPTQEIHARVAAPVNKQRSGRWKKDLTGDQVRIFEAVAGDLLAKLGYEVTDPNAKLKPFEKTIGRVGHKLLLLRPNTKPTGLGDRIKMQWHRMTFNWNVGE